MSGNAVRLAWERLRQRAGIVDLHFHDLRHEAVSRLFEKGLDMMAVAAISGHKTLSMLSRYTHLRAVDLVARLDERQSAPAPMSNVTTQQASGAINASHM